MMSSSPSRRRAAAGPPAPRPKPKSISPAASPGGKKEQDEPAPDIFPAPCGWAAARPTGRDPATIPRTRRRPSKLALRKALSARILDGDVLLVDKFAVAEPKTKLFVSLLAKTSAKARKTLVVSVAFDEATFKAARNVTNAQLTRADDVNTEQLLAFDKIVLTRDALEKLSERLAS